MKNTKDVGMKLQDKPREMTKKEKDKWIEKEKTEYFINCGYLS